MLKRGEEHFNAWESNSEQYLLIAEVIYVRFEEYVLVTAVNSQEMSQINNFYPQKVKSKGKQAAMSKESVLTVANVRVGHECTSMRFLLRRLSSVLLAHLLSKGESGREHCFWNVAYTSSALVRVQFASWARRKSSALTQSLVVFASITSSLAFVCSRQL